MITDPDLYKLSLQLHNSNMSEVLSDLQSRGFSYLFSLENECISCKDYKIYFKELDIIEVHRFEVKTSDAYDTLYAVECNNYDIKGVIISLSEIYANAFDNIVFDNIINNQNFSYKNYSFL